MNDLIITQSRLVQRADNFFIMQMNFCKTEASLSTSSVLLQIENCFYVPDLIEFGLSAGFDRFRHPDERHEQDIHNKKPEPGMPSRMQLSTRN